MLFNEAKRYENILIQENSPLNDILELRKQGMSYA